MSETVNIDKKGIFDLIKAIEQFITAFLKRAFDLTVSFFGLLFLSPLFGVFAIAIKHDSEGPVFYHADRIGRFGKPFKMLKFRTMYETPENHNGSPLTANGDKRITPIGQWLRDTKFNELPQLWNVLKGEMSLVGPRPECADFVEEWPEDLRNKVLSVRPGITSPASIIYHDEEQQLNGINFLDDYLKNIMPDKLRLDLLYVEGHSFFTDLDVIFMTLLTILPPIHRVKIKEKTIFSGPVYRFYTNYFEWFLIDFVMAFFSAGIAAIFWRMTEVINIGVGNVLLLAVIMAAFVGLINAILGLQRVVWRYASPVLVIDIAVSVVITSALLILINRLGMTEFVLPFDFMANFALLTFVGLVGSRYRERLITGIANRWMFIRDAKKSIGERVLIIGAGAGGELAVWLLNKSEYASAFSIVGFVDDDYRKANARLAGYPVIGRTRDIPTLIESRNIGLILFSISKISDSERKRILDLCEGSGARVIVIPDLLDILMEPNNHRVETE